MADLPCADGCAGRASRSSAAATWACVSCACSEAAGRARADHRPARGATLRAAGASCPLVGDLTGLRRWRAWRVWPTRCCTWHRRRGGTADPRTARSGQALARHGGLRRVVYWLTSGVYGDAAGALLDPDPAVAPATERAQRRVDARAAGALSSGERPGARVTLLRVPASMPPDRPGGDPRERPAPRHAGAACAGRTMYTNHVHADDLARARIAALLRGPTARDQRLRRHRAEDGRLLRPRRRLVGPAAAAAVSRDEAQAVLLADGQLSFMAESRRLNVAEHELRLRLRYIRRWPTGWPG